MKKDNLGLVAIGKVYQQLPATDAVVASLSARIDDLEGVNSSARLAALESAVTALELQIASLQSHTHEYEDDDGTTVTTKVTASN